jgi:hypothetical protein
MYIKKNLVSRTRKAQKLMAHLKKAQARRPGATHAPRSYFLKKNFLSCLLFKSFLKNNR